MLVGKVPLNLFIFSYSQMVCWKATWQITSTDSIPSKDMGMPFPQKLWHWYTIAKMFLQGLREHDMCYNIFNSQIMFRNYIPRLVKGIAYYYECSPREGTESEFYVELRPSDQELEPLRGASLKMEPVSEGKFRCRIVETYLSPEELGGARQ